MNLKYSIIIPVKNEEKNIKKTVETTRKFLKMPNEIIIVNDHSTDNTVKVALDLKDIRLTSTYFTGQGVAIMHGVKQARTNIVVPITGDLSDDPNDIEKLVEIVESGFDVACASRYASGARTIASDKLKRFLSIIVSFLCRVMFRVPTTDSTNSFRAYRKDRLMEIKISTYGYATAMDIILQAHKMGFKISEIPTTWINRVKGESKFKLVKQWKEYLKTFIRVLN